MAIAELKTLRKEVDNTLGGVVSIQNIFGDKTKHKKTNSLINEYNSLAIEYEVNKATDPQYENKEEAKEIKRIMKRVKYRINAHVSRNRKSLGLPEYIEKGDPEFLEQYLFDVEKQLANLDPSVVFKKVLMGDKKNGIVDVSDVTNKLHDLRKLEQRRMLAIQSYNNLSSIIREGKYMDTYVKNPNYDADVHKGMPATVEENGKQVPNPEHEEEFIFNEKLLRGNNYAKFQDERDTYRKEQRERQRQDAQESAAFQKNLQLAMKLSNKGTISDVTKKFKDAYARHYHGNEQTKGVKTLEHDEFSDYGKELQKDILRAQYNRQFDTSTKEKRDSFDMDGYTDLQARTRAYNDSMKKRRSKAEKEAKKMGLQLAKDYNDIYHEMGVDTAEQEYEKAMQTLSSQYDKSIVDLIRKEVDDLRKDLGVIQKQPEAKTAEDDEDGEQTGEQADLSQEQNDPTKQPSVKEPEGQSEPGNKGIDLKEEEQAQEDLLRKENLPTAEAYLTLRRSDLEYTEAGNFLPVRTMDKLGIGNIVRLNDNPSSDARIINMDGGEIMLEGITAAKHRTAIKEEQFDKWLKDGVVKKGYLANVYDDNGLVKTKQFKPELIDPTSPMHLAPGKEIRLVKVKDYDKLPYVKVLVKVGTSWKDTGIAYKLDPAGVLKQFRHDVDPKVVNAIQEELGIIITALKTTDHVDAVITSEQTGFGSLIFNQGPRGSREPFAIGKSFGLSFINLSSASKKVGTTFIGFIRSDSKKDASVVQATGDGKLFSINNRSDIYVPQRSIDALTKNGGKGGQSVMLVPTGRVYNSKQVYLPVLMNTRDMKEDTSTAMRRASGEAMTVGEAIIDTLLNPGKEENRQSMAKLFEFVGLPFDPVSPNWEAFYTNKNIFKIVNSVFFANDKTIGDSSYKYPFAIYAETTDTIDGKDKSIRVTIDITKDPASTLRKTKSKAVIYITQKDGKLNSDSVDTRLAGFLDKSETGVNKNLTYDDILDMVAQKPYKVDAVLASKSASETKNHKAIEFDKDGKLTVNTYESYLHYIDQKQLLTSTVQGIESEGKRFYFVNTPIAFRRKDITVSNEVKGKGNKEEGQKEGYETDLDKVFGNTRERELTEVAKAFQDRFKIPVEVISNKRAGAIMAASDTVHFMFQILDDVDMFNSMDLNEAKRFIDVVFRTVSGAEEAKKAYRKMTVKYHPDKAGDKGLEIMKYLNTTKERYDKGQIPRGGSTSSSSSTSATDDAFKNWYDEHMRRSRQENEAFQERQRQQAKRDSDFFNKTYQRAEKKADTGERMSYEEKEAAHTAAYREREQVRQDAYDERERKRKDAFDQKTKNSDAAFASYIKISTNRMSSDKEINEAKTKYNNYIQELKNWYDGVYKRTDEEYKKAFDQADVVYKQKYEKANAAYQNSQAYRQVTSNKGVSGFYDPRSGKAYIVHDIADDTTPIHEIFSHPFIIAIEKRNPALYNNLLKAARADKSIQEHMDKFYFDVPNESVADHERIARAIDLAAKGKLKNKTLLGYIKEFWKEVKALIKDIFGGKEASIENINANTTAAELVDFVLHSGAGLNLSGKVAPNSTPTQKRGTGANATADALKSFFESGIKTDDEGKIANLKDVPTGAFGSKLKSNFGAAKKGMIDFTKVVTVNQFALPGLDNESSLIAQDVNKEMIDLLLETYNNNRKVSFNRTRLKSELRSRLESKKYSAINEQERLWKAQGKKALDQVTMLGDRIVALEMALRYFDMNDFDKLGPIDNLSAQEHKDKVAYIDEKGERHYFVGFFNLAVSQLFKSKIVDIYAKGKEYVNFNDEDTLNYTRRFDDGWSFKVDPRDTLGKYARIVLSTIPQLEFNDQGNLQPVIGMLGTEKYVPYESAYKALISNTEGMSNYKVFDFIDSIPDQPETANNPTLRSVYQRLQSIRSEYGNDAYVQTVRQLFNPLLLQQANQAIVELETNPPR
jgi:uncharacterized protein Veg